MARVNAERFFDDVARVLAEPMPRRRAMRLIGASLAALTVPGISPRARAATEAPRQRQKFPPPQCSDAATPNGGHMCCKKTFGDGTALWKDCGYPWQGYDCVGPDGLTCVDRCRTTVQSGLPAGKIAVPTWSRARAPAGGPKKWDCCITPDTIPKDGECITNCKHLFGPRAIQCGKYCCPPGHRCKGGGQCIPCPSGREGCGSTCCKSGQDCKDCVDNGYILGGDLPNGRQKCCAKNQKCCGSRCCRKDRQCCGSLCCNVPRARCARLRGRDICCPANRFLVLHPFAYCCPTGTVPIRGKGCCPLGDPDCCPPSDGLGNVLDCDSLGKICVRGACVFS